MKFIVKNHTGKGYKSLITVHKRNGSYQNDVKDDKSKTPPVTIRSDILKDLLVEQGYICAYCMIKIDDKTATIEHIIGQSYKDEEGKEIGKIEDTNYDNMLAVCEGNSCQNNLHCDKSRADFQSKRPVLSISPLNKQQMENIKFAKSGVVYYKVPQDEIVKSSETSEDKEIRFDIKDVLKLNCENLRVQRERVIQSLKSILIKHKFDKTFAKKELERWQKNNGNHKAFCQVAIYELQKHI